MSSQGRCNSVELKWSSNAEHVKIMPFISACGKVWSLVIILSGKQTKYLARPDPMKPGYYSREKPA